MVMVGDSPRSDHDGPKGMGMEAVLLCRHGGRPDRSAIEGLRELPGRVRSLMRRKLSDRWLSDPFKVPHLEDTVVS
jgi:FMN phosphatase YigB (HAD superfamily)